MKSKGTLLVVDDDALNREVLSRRLIRAGYEVLIAGSAREALDLLETRPIDLALFDVMMPEVSGLDALVEVRTRRSLYELPVIMVTANDASEDVVEALRLGANDYVTKPVDFPILLARVRTQLDARRLMLLKDEFLRIASHDLKNPISEILGVTQLVSLEVPVGATMTEDMAALLALVQESASRMQGIVEDFLDVQALEEGALRITRLPVCMNALAREAYAHQRGLADRKGITLALELAARGPVASADARRLAQVIQNLVDNAIKFCSAGDVVTVRTRWQDGRALLEVSDTGPGLRPADFERVFTRYALLSNRPTGGEKSSGLGLAICKQMIVALGGQIGVQNNADRGATFYIDLPGADQASLQIDTAVAAGHD